MKFNFSAVLKHLLTSARITLNERRGPAPARPMRDGTSSLENGLSVGGGGGGRGETGCEKRQVRRGDEGREE